MKITTDQHKSAACVVIGLVVYGLSNTLLNVCPRPTTYIKTQQWSAKKVHTPIPVAILAGTRVQYFNKVVAAVAGSHLNCSFQRTLFVVGENATRLNITIPHCIVLNVQDIHLKSGALHLKGPHRLKHVWYAAMHLVWGALPDYIGDVVFLEDDVLPSPDFFTALDFSSAVKQQNRMFQLIAMGGWGGENQIDADAHTFTMKASSSFPTMGYAFDRMLWDEVARVEQSVLADHKSDWAESVTSILCQQATKRNFPAELSSFHRSGHIKIIQPTLSRVWHIGVLSQVGNAHETSNYRWPAQPTWQSMVLMQNTTSGVLLPGMHDIFGFKSDTWQSVTDNAAVLFPVSARHTVVQSKRHTLY